MRFLILILCITFSVFASENWAHLELGAGNYGKTGGKATPDVQYKVLFWTLDELVSRFGPVGVVYINDIKICRVCCEVFGGVRHRERLLTCFHLHFAWRLHSSRLPTCTRKHREKPLHFDPPQKPRAEFL